MVIITPAKSRMVFTIFPAHILSWKTNGSKNVRNNGNVENVIAPIATVDTLID